MSFFSTVPSRLQNNLRPCYSCDKFNLSYSHRRTVAEMRRIGPLSECGRATYALQQKRPMKSKTERNESFSVRLTSSSCTFVNLELNKSKLSFCKSRTCTNVNSAFAMTRHGEFTFVRTKGPFCFCKCDD